MRSRDYFPSLARPSLAVLLVVLGLPSAFLLAMILIGKTQGVAFEDISRDPSFTLGGSALTGIQSHLGVLLWFAGASVALFSFGVLRRWPNPAGDHAYLLWGGLATLLLALDDLLQLHEDVVPSYLGQGERRVFLVYAVLLALFLWRYRRALLASEGGLLALAIALFALSVAVDQTSSLWGESEWRIFTEDGLKLLGITAWSSFFIRRGFAAVTHSRGRAPIAATPQSRWVA